MTWSRKYQLSKYLNAPKKAGVYIIGIPNGYFSEPGEVDNFLGENYPDNFEPMYVGISKRSIRSRLYSHYKGNGNKHVRDHIEKNGSENIFFIFDETLKTEIEDVFLFSLVNGFPWNVKRREEGNWIKFITNL